MHRPATRRAVPGERTLFVPPAHSLTPSSQGQVRDRTVDDPELSEKILKGLCHFCCQDTRLGRVANGML